MAFGAPCPESKQAYYRSLRSSQLTSPLNYSHYFTKSQTQFKPPWSQTSPLGDNPYVDGGKLTVRSLETNVLYLKSA